MSVLSILIRIEFGRLDPDPGGQNMSCFEVINVSFGI